MDPAVYVEVRDLVGGYGEQIVLHHVSLKARRGEITVVLGQSGCGKSTLLRHIAGLQAPLSGSVLLGGQDLYQASEDQQERMLRNLGMSFQGGALFNSMTLLENVALPVLEHTGADRPTAETLARMKLDQVGLLDAAHKLPAELSGGMKKRAALARAMALDPALLLFDEPSAGLDPVTARSLDELIMEQRDRYGVAILVVTHELRSIRTIADQAIMLADGRVLAAGPLEQVQAADDPRVRAFFAPEQSRSRSEPTARPADTDEGLLPKVLAPTNQEGKGDGTGIIQAQDRAVRHGELLHPGGGHPVAGGL